MKLWDKIKQMLGINQPKQLQAPQEENQYVFNEKFMWKRYQFVWK